MHTSKLGRILSVLDAVITPVELNQPAYKRHPFKSPWSVWVNGNWRVTFQLVGPNIEWVDYQDYH